MAKRKAPKTMQDHIVRFMQLLDSQVARDLQRRPEEREQHGAFDKNKPISDRVEILVGHFLEQFGSGDIKLDSLLISAESFTTALRIIVEELGKDGLGKKRSEYVENFLSSAQRDYLLTKEILQVSKVLN